jgi:two-component system, NarL family, response regulator YdfI
MDEVRPGVFLITIDGRRSVTNALRAGARAVLPDTATEEDIDAAVAATGAGLIVLHPDAIAALIPGSPAAAGAAGGAAGEEPGERGEAGEHLTARESAVLELLADGLGNKQVAARLGISDHTVKAHLVAIFAKLGVSTRTGAVTVGARRGLIAL